MKIVIRDLAGHEVYDHSCKYNNVKQTVQKMISEGYSLASLDLSHSDLSDMDMAGVDLSNSTLAYSKLTGTDFSESTMTNVNLNHAMLTNVNFTSTVF